MNESEMPDLLKALADADWLRIVGLLAHKAAPLAEITTTLGFHSEEALRHLDDLLQSGVIRLSQAVYELDSNGLEQLLHRQLDGRRSALTTEAGWRKNPRQILAAYLTPAGRLRQMPSQPAKRQVILNYLINAFSVGANYTEKEVNLILVRFHPDTAALRRSLVDAGMLGRERNGSRYWRPQ
jgi:hypothetical protein